MQKYLLLILFAFFSIEGKGQIVVSPLGNNSVVATNIINTKFISPSGVFPGSIQNVTVKSSSAGRFSTFSGTSNIGFNEGIILCTGNALQIPQAASVQFNDGIDCSQTSTIPASCFDPQLASLSPTNPILDITTLEFDFQPLNDTIRFEYVFASEEYPEYVCNFNDVFGFFINGPNPAGGNYINKNFALIPGTNLPVSVNSINPGVPGAASGGGTCNLSGQSLAHSNLYVNNLAGSTIVFDGFTKVLTVTIPVLTCAVYHIKMGVANAKDGIFESAVFLKANSFGGSFNIPITASHGPAGTDSVSTFLCNGDSITLCAANAVNYSWSNGATTQCITIGFPDTGYYSMLVVNPLTGCVVVSGTSFYVNGNNSDTTVAVNGSLTLCNGDSVQLTCNGFGASYVWSNGDTTKSIWVNFPGSYNCTFADTGVCGAILSETIAVFSTAVTPVINAAGNTNICPGATVALSAFPPGSSSYLWSNGATTQNINAGAGVYTVTVGNGACAAASLPMPVNVSIPNININSSGPLTFCQGGSVSLIASPGYQSYVWNTLPVSNNDSVTVNSAGLFQVIAADSIGCKDTATANVIVNTATASITALSDSILCPGDSIQIFANPVGGISYSWLNNGIPTGQTGQSVWVNAAGSYSVNVQNANTCSKTSSPVNVFMSIPQATISPSGNVVICQYDSTALTASNGSATNNLAYQWSNNTTLNTTSVIGNGNYAVTVIITDSIGCKATSSAVNIITSIPVAQIISPVAETVTLCPNQNVTLQANFGTVYLWSNGTNTNQTTVSTEGNYNVSVTDSVGCVAISANIFIDTLSAFANVVTSGPLDFCQGGDVTITATTPGTYIWSDSLGTTGNQITASTSGTYLVTITNTNGCIKKSDPVIVDVHDFPAISFSVDSSSECDAFRILFNNQSQFDGGSQFYWSFGDGDSSRAQSPVHGYIIEGTYVVVLTIVSPYGCSSTDSSTVNIIRYPYPIASFATNTPIENVFAGPVSFTNTSLYAVRYLWDFGDQSGSTDVNPIHGYREPGYYKVVLTAFNPASCEDKENMEITISPIFIPSAFTPNGDGKNEVFPGFIPSFDISKYEFIVWNRWGERVFESKNPSLSWSGRLENGDPATVGVYLYQIKISDELNKDFSYKGKFSLIR